MQRDDEGGRGNNDETMMCTAGLKYQYLDTNGIWRLVEPLLLV